MDTPQNTRLQLSSQRDVIATCIASLETVTAQEIIENILTETFESAPDNVTPDAPTYYSIVNYHLYRYTLKHYKHKEDKICFWRFIKCLSHDQLNYKYEPNAELTMLDQLIRVYYYSDPLDDLTCVFTPIDDVTLITKYLDWIRSYFYDANYPTSLLWLYALDSSLASLFPEEIIYLGKRKQGEDENIMIPDFHYRDTVLIKRFSFDLEHFSELRGEIANNEFQQIFTFLQQECRDRCLSRSGKQDEYPDKAAYKKEWEKFKDVLTFGVSDKHENGCISFSDLRRSTDFLITYGKNVFLHKIQQPFFEKTKFITKKYNGRIDKFMGDNVMCVFLNSNMRGMSYEEREEGAILNSFFALFDLTKVLYELTIEQGFEASGLGLRSGVTYGDQVLRSNLGNEIVRDFTVTGGTVNLAARLEHTSIRELAYHNKTYFERARERFSQISEITSIRGNYENLNPETKTIIQDFTLYQNICSNLEKLEKIKYDIRLNQSFYSKLRDYFKHNGYEVINPETSEMYGYEEYHIEDCTLQFYFSYYNPKGFQQYEKIWILPLEVDTLQHLDIEKIR